MTSDIDRRLKWLFVREIEVQCRYALLAFDSLTRLPDLVPVVYPREEGDPAVHPLAPQLGRMRGTPWIAGRWYDASANYTDADELAFFFAHAFLTHAAAVSRILDPPPLKPRKARPSPFTPEERAARSAALKQALGVEVPLLSGSAARDVRNSLEHADERLEAWFKTPAGQNLDLIDLNHTPFGWSSGAAVPAETDVFRMLGGRSLSFRFRAELQDLEPMAEELRRLLDAAMTWQEQVAPKGIRQTTNTDTESG